ncbi:MAG: hypothetical protein R3E86_15590 [Pseudomonadales bacterium]
MSEPTYLGLLNSIAVNECKGERLLSAWANATPDAQLAETLRFVAIREGEHAAAFTKRLCELGCAVDEASAFQVFKDFEGLLACVSSTASDADKIAQLGGLEEREDPFGGFFKDTTIDPETGALLGRYIAEERDSGRRLRAQYQRICGAASAPAASELAELRACVDALRQEIDELKRMRSVA